MSDNKNTKPFLAALSELDSQSARDAVKGHSELAYNLGYKEGLYAALRLAGGGNKAGDVHPSLVGSPE